MVVQPIFRPHIRPVTVAGTGILLLGVNGTRVLQGRLAEALLRLIDGRRTTEEIVEALQADFPAAHVYYALLMLEREGYLTESDKQSPPANAAFWSLYGLDASEIAGRLEVTRVSIKALNKNLSEELLSEALSAVGVRTGDDGNLAVVLVEDYLDPLLETINRDAITSGQIWILGKPTGTTPWIGPLFNLPKTGCWECLASRLRQHRGLERSLFRGDDLGVSAPRCDTLLTRQVAYSILATEILKWIASEEQCMVRGGVLSVDTHRWQTKVHKLVKRPQCTACGRHHYRTELQPVPIELSHRWIRFSTDGGYRCTAPEETFQRCSHHVSSITGAVRGLYRQHQAMHGLKAYVAVSNLGSCPADPLRNYSGGKGITEIQAKVSALCESLERYSGVYQGYEPGVVSSLRALGDKAIYPNSCMLYSDGQYRSRAEPNLNGSKYRFVPEPFDENRDIRWSPVWSLSRKEFRFLPTSYCYFGYTDSLPAHLRYCLPCSNGNAAGNTLEEAILQALFELVERDSVGIWWYNRLRRPEVELATFCEPYCNELKEHYQESGRQLWALDITTDLQIPVFAAISTKLDGGGPILLGFGCHLDPRLAMLRALTEMNQMFLTAFSLESNLRTPLIAVDEEMTNWMKTVSLTDQPQVVPDPATSRRTAAEYRQWHSRNICDAIYECQSTLESQGLEVLVLDQTRPDIELAVVKVVVPGLRHLWARYAPGRLYEVPVKMGWLSAPRREDELNRIPITF
jgi:bacteriocin biosynthesis cyclodehydratase domain-containing protein